MADELNWTMFVRTPFAVEATLITPENIDEVAALVGTVRIKNGEKYISLDRRVVPNISRAFVGWYLTRLGDNLRCYSPKVFLEQFEVMPDSLQAAYDFRAEIEEKETTAEVEDTQPPGEGLVVKVRE